MPGLHAASLQVSPTRVTLQHDRGAEGLTLGNTGSEEIHVQVRVFRWWQEDNEDMLDPSDELVASPPMLRLPPGGEQLIRIVYAGPAPPPGGERSYRIIVDELPVEGVKQDGPGLRFALRYSVPVFVVENAYAPPTSDLHTRVTDAATGPVIEVSNSGQGSAQLADLTVIDARGTRHLAAPGLVGYVMPGQSRRFPAPPGLSATDGIEARVNGEPQARALVPHR